MGRQVDRRDRQTGAMKGKQQAPDASRERSVDDGGAIQAGGVGGESPGAAPRAAGGSAGKIGEAPPAAVATLFPHDKLEAIYKYVEILSKQGIDWGLIGPKEAGRIWSRHVLNCAALAPLVGEGSRVCDVGSGAGLPGIPLALARPDLQVTLLEPLQRRAEFLRQAVDTLGLGSRVNVVRGRAEEHRDRYQVVTARAVAPLPRLMGWCLPLLDAGGTLLALKGESAEREVLEVRALLRRQRLIADVIPVLVAEGLPETRVVRVRGR